MSRGRQEDGKERREEEEGNEDIKLRLKCFLIYFKMLQNAYRVKKKKKGVQIELRNPFRKRRGYFVPSTTRSLPGQQLSAKMATTRAACSRGEKHWIIEKRSQAEFEK